MLFLFLACHAGGAGRQPARDETPRSAGLVAEPEPENCFSDFSAVIEGFTPGLSIYDRIAFSCRFMDGEWVDTWWITRFK
eukprot:SAG31_NODE_8181_length_1501_cov_1.791013_2_plen_80_part_00